MSCLARVCFVAMWVVDWAVPPLVCMGRERGRGRVCVCEVIG